MSSSLIGILRATLYSKRNRLVIEPTKKTHSPQDLNYTTANPSNPVMFIAFSFCKAYSTSSRMALLFAFTKALPLVTDLAVITSLLSSFILRKCSNYTVTISSRLQSSQLVSFDLHPSDFFFRPFRILPEQNFTHTRFFGKPSPPPFILLSLR